MTHDHGPRPVALAGRPGRSRARRGGGPGRFAGCLGRRNVTTVKALIAGRGRHFRHSSHALSIAREKRKFNNHYPNRMHSFAPVPWPAAAPGPGRSGGSGRRRGGGERTRSHTAAATLARRPRLEPYAAAMAIWADILTGARRPGETGGRAALAASRAVSDAVRRAGRSRRLPARAVNGQCSEAALGGPETRRSPIPSRRG